MVCQANSMLPNLGTPRSSNFMSACVGPYCINPSYQFHEFSCWDVTEAKQRYCYLDALLPRCTDRDTLCEDRTVIVGCSWPKCPEVFMAQRVCRSQLDLAESVSRLSSRLSTSESPSCIMILNPSHKPRWICVCLYDRSCQKCGLRTIILKWKLLLLQPRYIC